MTKTEIIDTEKVKLELFKVHKKLVIEACKDEDIEYDEYILDNINTACKNLGLQTLTLSDESIGYIISMAKFMLLNKLFDSCIDRHLSIDDLKKADDMWIKDNNESAFQSSLEYHYLNNRLTDIFGNDIEVR